MEEKLRVDNPANSYMNSGGFHLGVVNPPDSFPKYEIYNSRETHKLYYDLQKDIYDKKQKTKPIEVRKNGFPRVLLYLGGLILALVVNVACKNPLGKLFNKFLKP